MVLELANSYLIIRIGLFTIIPIHIVQMLEIIAVCFFVDKQIMLALFKYLKLVFFEHNHVDASCCLEGFIIKIKIIVKLNSEHKTADEYAMDVETIESETLKINVPVHDNNCYDQALRGEVGELVDSTDVVFEGDFGDFFGVKDSVEVIGRLLRLVLIAIYYVIE